MTPKQLKSRQKFIKATPVPNRNTSVVLERRDGNYVREEEDYRDNFDDFFEYEEELSQLKPSNSQASQFSNDSSPGFITMEEHGSNLYEETNNDFIAMESVEPATSSIIMDEVEPESTTYMDVSGFKFVQCSFEKKDGNRCKRQAPKGASICSIHKKFIERNKK